MPFEGLSRRCPVAATDGIGNAVADVVKARCHDARREVDPTRQRTVAATGEAGWRPVAAISAVVSSTLFALSWLDQERRWSRSARSETTRFLSDGSPAPAFVPAEPALPPPVTMPAVA